MAFKSFKLLKNRKNKNRKKELQSKKMQQSLRNELMQKLEQELSKNKIVCYEVPERVLADFIDILDEEFSLLYNYKQTTNSTFEFSMRTVI